MMLKSNKDPPHCSLSEAHGRRQDIWALITYSSDYIVTGLKELSPKILSRMKQNVSFEGKYVSSVVVWDSESVS